MSVITKEARLYQPMNDGVDLLLVACNKCSWVSMGVTREYAVAQVAEFNAWLAAQKPDVQESYAGPSTLEKSYSCIRCGNLDDFRPAKPGDCPDGCTISPVVYEEEKT